MFDAPVENVDGEQFNYERLFNVSHLHASSSLVDAVALHCNFEFLNDLLPG